MSVRHWWWDRQTARFRAAWAERERALADVRANGWPRVRNAVRERGEQVWQATSQAPGKAWQAGKAMASRVIQLQKDAGLDAKLVRRSLLSVELTPRTATKAHAEWVTGYRAQVEKTWPGMAADPKAEPEAAE